MYVYYPQGDTHSAQLGTLIAELAALGVNATLQPVNEKIGQKWLKQAAAGSLLVDDQGLLSLIAHTERGAVKVSANWSAEQQRVVKAGKKSELLLKAAKLQAGMQVIDATAGFGHDSLILASAGAAVTLIEAQPMMAVLLSHELKHMAEQPNWQKLVSRLNLHIGDAAELLPSLPKADRVYLDPMFPPDSYKAAVSKTMQTLHAFAKPPTLAEEIRLLTRAQAQLVDGGKVIVKRPLRAPHLAMMTPDDSVGNALIRFDIYHASHY